MMEEETVPNLQNEDLGKIVPNFQNGDLGNIKRVVNRQQLKTRLKFYEQLIKTHQPLIEAMKITRKAYQDGVQFGFQKAVTEIQQAEKERETNSAQQGAPPTIGPGETIHVQVSPPHVDLPRASDDLQKVLQT